MTKRFEVTFKVDTGEEAVPFPIKHCRMQGNVSVIIWKSFLRKAFFFFYKLTHNIILDA